MHLWIPSWKAVGPLEQICYTSVQVELQAELKNHGKIRPEIKVHCSSHQGVQSYFGLNYFQKIWIQDGPSMNYMNSDYMI
jgi:hypothetical protein